MIVTLEGMLVLKRQILDCCCCVGRVQDLEITFKPLFLRVVVQPWKKTDVGQFSLLEALGDWKGLVLNHFLFWEYVMVLKGLSLWGYGSLKVPNLGKLSLWQCVMFMEGLNFGIFLSLEACGVVDLKHLILYSCYFRLCSGLKKTNLGSFLLWWVLMLVSILSWQ